MPSVTSLLENHHPTLSPIPGSPAHRYVNGSVVNNNNNGSLNNNNNGIGGSNTPTFDNLVQLARNLGGGNSSPSTGKTFISQSPNQVANYGNTTGYPSHQFRYAVIANRISQRSQSQTLFLGSGNGGGSPNNSFINSRIPCSSDVNSNTGNGSPQYLNSSSGKVQSQIKFFSQQHQQGNISSIQQMNSPNNSCRHNGVPSQYGENQKNLNGNTKDPSSSSIYDNPAQPPHAWVMSTDQKLEQTKDAREVC